MKTPAPKLTAALGDKVCRSLARLFLPYLSGERTPVADAAVRGLCHAAFGHETDAKILTHAVLDGVAFAFRDYARGAEGRGHRSRAASPRSAAARAPTLWLKIIATVLGLPVDVPTDGDFGGAFGAARLGLIAATGADFTARC